MSKVQRVNQFKKHLIVILAHDNRECLEDMVFNVKFFCPQAFIAVYNSGQDNKLTKNLDVINIHPARKLEYAKITWFFFDLFSWLSKNNYPFDYITNLDSDVLFIRKGFSNFVFSMMKKADYLAQGLRLNIQTRPKWRPIRSLKPELKEWYKVLGFQHMNGAFNPGQTFSKLYIQKLINHNKFNDLLYLVENNKSFTLHEVLFPTLVDLLELRGVSYPKETNTSNRYRPYQAISGIERALSIKDSYFVHPVHRIENDPAREYIHKILEKSGTNIHGSIQNK